MKPLFFVTGILIFSFFDKPAKCYCPLCAGYADTGHIIHVLDGSVAEWPADKFHLNDDSTVEYAADNDDKNLYLAMSVPDFDMQMKIMRNGMKLFIDLKGKKKEAKGVEFPVKGEAGNFQGHFSGAPLNSNSNNDDQQKKKFDKKTVRGVMSLGLTALKLFGIAGNELEEQGLSMPGSVNIMFKWDDSDVMHIEYNIPLNILGELTSLNQKDISLGWKINGFERPAGMERPGESEGNTDGGGFSRGMGEGGGRSQYGGGGRGFGGRTRGTTSRKIDPDEMRKEQNFWTKYMIIIQPAKKTF
jgi:hypothetical protein